ncbi:MAG: hypothetical protein [Cressdnaviricota sp.]|nr:MAG: hypothetical protein [Cressdnaviricota sp.]
MLVSYVICFAALSVPKAAYICIMKFIWWHNKFDINFGLAPCNAGAHRKWPKATRAIAVNRQSVYILRDMPYYPSQAHSIRFALQHLLLILPRCACGSWIIFYLFCTKFTEK